MVVIKRKDGTVRKSQNLRGVLSYHRDAGTFMRRIVMYIDHAKNAPKVRFVWDDGAECETCFADYRVLRAFVMSRVKHGHNIWSGAEVTDILP